MRNNLLLLFMGTYLLPWVQKPLVLNKHKTHFFSVRGNALFASAYETSNADYQSYLTWLQNNEGQEAYKKAFPDTNVWVSGKDYREKFKTYYFSHPAYRNYPVVGLSYEQASAYCQWLTKIWNDRLPDKNIKKVVFRLPTESEWETAAYGGMGQGNVYPWGSDRIDVDYVTHKNPILANYRRSSNDYMGVAGSLTDGMDVTTAVKTFTPNAFGLYQMAGNVAELVQEKGILKGGSWGDPSYKLTIPYRDTLKTPTSCFVGFRVFAEIEAFQKKENRMKISAKQLEKTTTRVICTPGMIYNFEVSNAFYLSFLESLDSNERKKHQPVDSLWSKETDELVYQHYTEQFPNHPVVNIEKQSMIAFCAWLEKKYNLDPKRTWNKVSIRLPSKNEWTLSVSNGEPQKHFIWRYPRDRDAQGEFLLNFNPLPSITPFDIEAYLYSISYKEDQRENLLKSRQYDGYCLTAPVNSFSQKGINIQNIHGNVGEALADTDVIIGGSFASILEHCMAPTNYEKYEEKINLPSPYVGFRFFMEVLEP